MNLVSIGSIIPTNTVQVSNASTLAIQAPVQTPAVHPHDKALLRPLAALGKLKVAEANVSFLRRTEYISSMVPRKHENNSPRSLLAKAKKPQRGADSSADSPQVIKRKIDRSFEVAEQDLKDPKRVKHPSKRHLKLVEAVPLLPDLDAFPDSGAYVTIKFLTNPASTSNNSFDSRMLSGLFRPIDKTEEEEAQFEAATAAHERDPHNVSKPQNLMNYDFYLGQTGDTGGNFQRMFDIEDPDNDNETLYTDRANNCFQFNRVRAYETAQEIELDHPTKYQEEVLVAYNDDTSNSRQKAMYYYPVMQKSTVRPQRTKNIARTVGIHNEQEQIVDQLDITVENPHEEMLDAMKRYKETPLGWQEEEQEEEQAQQEASPEPSRRERSPSDDKDADGDDDE